MKQTNGMLFWVITIALAGFFIGSVIVALAPFIILAAVLMWAFYALRAYLRAQPDDEPARTCKSDTASSEAEDDGILVKVRVVETKPRPKILDQILSD